MSLLSRTLISLTSSGGFLEQNDFAKALIPFAERLQSMLPVSQQEVDSRFSVIILKTILGIATGTQKEIRENKTPDVFVDYRIKGVALKGVRYYPAKESEFYGVRMRNMDRKPCSAIFLGVNGVGKSSIYCALEWATLGYSDIANQRGYLDKQQVQFIRNLRTELEGVKILLSTEQGRFSHGISTSPRPIAYPAYFCMEHDVESLYRTISPMFIARQLGMMDYLEFIKILRNMIGARDASIEEYSELSNGLKIQKARYWLMERFGQLQEKQKFFNEIQQGKAFYEDWSHPLKDKKAMEEYHRSKIKELVMVLLPDQETADTPDSDDIFKVLPKSAEIISLAPPDIKKLNPKGLEEYLNKIGETFQGLFDLLWSWQDHRVSEYRIDKSALEEQKNIIESINSDLEEIRMDMPLIEVSQKVINEMQQTLNALVSHYTGVLAEVQQTGNRVFAALFDGFFEPDLQRVEIRIPSDGLFGIQVVLSVKDPQGKEEEATNTATDPQRFLNTFRFKLFCVALKAALAFTCSKIYKMNFPLVMDDIFDSSDFSNRRKIREFIYHLFKVHHGLFGEKHPLQVIFFTQDDVVGESVYKGIRDFSPDEGVKYSRLFPYRELEDEDWEPCYADGLYGSEAGLGKIKVGIVEDLITRI